MKMILAQTDITPILDKFEWWQLFLVGGVLIILIFLFILALINMLTQKKGDFQLNLFGIKLGKKDKPEEKSDSKPEQVITPIPQVVVNFDGISKPTVETDSNIEELDSVEDSSPKNCIDFKDFYVLLNRAWKLSANITEISCMTIIKEQIKIAEKKNESLKNSITREYIDALYRERKDEEINVMLDSSFMIFNYLIKDLLQNWTLNDFRKAFRENHLSDYYDDVKYDKEYVDDRCKSMIDSLRVQIDIIIPDFLSPGKDCIKSIINKIEPELYRAIRDTFHEARLIAIKYEKEVERKIKFFNQEAKRQTGTDNIISI
jgi:hypothetical protein